MKTPIDDIFAKMSEDETAMLLEGFDIAAVDSDDIPKTGKFRPMLRRITAVAAALLMLSVLAVSAAAVGVTVIVPALRNLFEREEELVNPWAEPIQSGAVVDEEENTVFTLEKAVKDGDNIFIYYSIDTDGEYFGDLIGYELLTITTSDGEMIHHSLGSILAGEILCKAEQGGGIIHIKREGGYTGELTLKIQKLYSADSYKLTMENYNDISQYAEIIAESVEINFTLPELDNMEYTMLVDDKEMTIEGHRALVDIRVSPLTIEAIIYLPDYEGYESIACLVNGTTFEEFQEASRKQTEAFKNGTETWIYQYRKQMRLLRAQFVDYEDEHHYHNRWSSTGYDGWALNGVDGEENTTKITMTFIEPISPDEIVKIVFGYDEVMRYDLPEYPEGKLVTAEEFGGDIVLYDVNED